MFVSTSLSFIAGMLLGSRFRVGILVPAIVIILVATFVLGSLSGRSLPLTIASGTLALTALQAGYLCGALSAVRSPLKLGQPDGLGISAHDSR